MPVQSCSDGDRPGYKWGDRGKCYIYTPGDEKSAGKAKQQAYLQGVAIGEVPAKKSLYEESLHYLMEDYSIQFSKKEEYVDGCPIATQDIKENLKNRAIAINAANYGPMNPELPNDEFWQAKADLFNTSIDEAKTARCGNCAAFIQTKDMIDCIAGGLGGEGISYDVVDAANLGYCEIFDFKCAGERTCDAWVVGGPITDMKNQKEDLLLAIKEFIDKNKQGGKDD